MRTKLIVKASLFTLILAFMVIGTIAIAEVMKNENVAVEKRTINQPWFYNSGSPTQSGSYSDAPIAECGDLNEVICEIHAPDNGLGQPDMQAEVAPGVTVQEQIEQALSGTPTTNATVQSFRAE